MKKQKNNLYVPDEPKNSTDHLDLTQAVPAPDMPNLKFSTESVTLRMSASMVNQLKMQAHKRDIPYQSLMKMILSDWLTIKRRAA
ncbi:MAG: CopG family antitoxin [Verrucomicrobiota bacterium]